MLDFLINVIRVGLGTTFTFDVASILIVKELLNFIRMQSWGY